MKIKNSRVDVILVYLLTILCGALIIFFNPRDREFSFRVLTGFALAVAGLIYEVLTLRKEKKSAAQNSGLLNSVLVGLYVLTVLISGYGGILIISAAGLQFLFWCGFCLYLSGFMLRCLAKHALQSIFSYSIRIGEYSRLVTSGIYAVVRHPAYLGTYLMLLGLSLLFGTSSGVVLVALSMPLGIRQIKKEEEQLLKFYGDRYLKYKSAVKIIIPFIF